MESNKSLPATDLVQIAASLPSEKYWPVSQFAAGDPTTAPSLCSIQVPDWPEAHGTVSASVKSHLARLDFEAT